MVRLLFSPRLCLVFLLGVVSSAGCGEPKVALVPVSGKVTVGGQAIAAGQVSLIAEDPKAQADLSTGSIDANGEYKIFTGGKEGAPLGKYRVTVNSTMVPTGGTSAPAMGFDRQYSDAKATPLKIEVVSNPASGAYDLKLTK